MADRDQGSGVGSSLGLTHLEVNLDGLDAFRALLHREVDVNLRPGVARISDRHMHGAGFGLTTRSAAVQAARASYTDALAASMDVLHRYVQIARALVEGVHAVGANYRGSDLSDADMMTLLTNMLVNVTTADNQAAARAAARDDAREIHKSAWAEA